MSVISIPPERPVDPLLTGVLDRLDRTCQEQGIRYFLTGAMAREILLVNLHGLPPGRATRDVDFGLSFQTWSAFDAFKAALVANEHFVPDLRIPHRVYSVPERLGIRMPVDLVPFGGLEAPEGIVSWPPDGAVIMDVRGYVVAFEHSIPLAIRPGLIVHLPSPEGVTIMKTLAWKARGPATHGRDAIDLLEILVRAEDIIGLETLYEDHLDIVERSGGDPRRAAAWVIGDQARQTAGIPLSQEMTAILLEGLNENLVTQILAGSGGFPSPERQAAIEEILWDFLGGLRASTPDQ
jgi:predicted nucleotidyltransferase